MATQLTMLTSFHHPQVMIDSVLMNVDKSDPDCELCGSGLCTECIRYALEPSEFTRIECMLHDAIDLRGRARRDAESESDQGPQRVELPASSGKRRRTTYVRP